jgi:hypothetical protein
MSEPRVARTMKSEGVAVKSQKRVAITERSLQRAAARLLPKTKKLVSTEIDYLQRVLGETATQHEIDEKVVMVRRLPWSSLIAD